MYQTREKVVHGTPDFPFAFYSLRKNPVNAIITPPHWHPEQEILCVSQGCIHLLMEKTVYVLNDGDIAFVPPNTLHCVVSRSENSHYHALVFSYDLVSMPETHFFQKELVIPLRSMQLCFPPIVDSNDAIYPQIQPLLGLICDTKRSDPYFKRIVLQNLIALLSAMQDELTPPREPAFRRDNEAVKNCMLYINQHFWEKISLESLAAYLHIHPNYLCTLFKEHTGQTVFQYLHRIRMEHAAKLLRKQNQSISQIATACGFESNSFFSRKFKEFMGIPPKKYSTLSKTPSENSI